MPTSLITLNSTNYVGNSSYQLNILPNNFTGMSLSLDSLSMYNSIFNITAKYGNNQFSIKWIDGTIYNFVIPDSYMEYTALNVYIEQQCLLNNLYMTSTDGSTNIFFFKISSNLQLYKVELDVYYVPTSANATILGWILPTGATWSLPSVNTCPQIQFNAGLNVIMGLSQVQYYPVNTTSGNQTILSDTIPKLLQVFNILVACSLVYNPLNQNDSRIIGQIPILTSFGSLITINKNIFSQFKIRDGIQNQIIIQLLDNNYNILPINDTDFSISLLISN